MHNLLISQSQLEKIVSGQDKRALIHAPIEGEYHCCNMQDPCGVHFSEEELYAIYNQGNTSGRLGQIGVYVTQAEQGTYTVSREPSKEAIIVTVDVDKHCCYNPWYEQNYHPVCPGNSDSISLVPVQDRTMYSPADLSHLPPEISVLLECAQAATPQHEYVLELSELSWPFDETYTEVRIHPFYFQNKIDAPFIILAKLKLTDQGLAYAPRQEIINAILKNLHPQDTWTAIDTKDIQCLRATPIYGLEIVIDMSHPLGQSFVRELSQKALAQRLQERTSLSGSYGDYGTNCRVLYLPLDNSELDDRIDQDTVFYFYYQYQ